MKIPLFTLQAWSSKVDAHVLKCKNKKYDELSSEKFVQVRSGWQGPPCKYLTKLDEGIAFSYLGCLYNFLSLYFSMNIAIHSKSNKCITFGVTSRSNRPLILVTF